jgi:hypothetical protein
MQSALLYNSIESKTSMIPLADGHTDFMSSSTGNLWGDTLRERDLDLICGVYKVEGKSGKP